MEVGAIKLRLVFHVKLIDEKLVVTLDSPDQGARGILLDETSIEGASIKIVSQKMKASYSGVLQTANDRIDGTWSQNGREFPLVLTRTVADTARRRPQTPQPPFPYHVEVVTYRHLSQNFELAATLTIPPESANAPSVILISGSGAQDRDESIFETQTVCCTS